MIHEVKVREVDADERARLQNAERPALISLRQVTSGFGGYEFDLELSDGTMVPVSLEEYRGRVPDSTLLQIEVVPTPESEDDA